MSELHERFIDGLFETRWQPSAQPEFHKGENKQSRQVEVQSEADKMKHIVIELTTMPLLALEMPVLKHTGEPDPPYSDTTISLLDIIEILLRMIVDGAKVIFQKRKEKN